MKKILFILLFISLHTAALACEVCKRQQPKVLRDITHGAGPQSEWDYVIIVAMSIIVIITLFYSINWLVRPGERNEDHIKNSILNFE
jgi:uncharacterized protein HemY